MDRFETGCLVRWQNGEYGVVVGVDFKRVTVRIDGQVDPMIFSTEAGVIAPIDLSSVPLLLRRSTGEVGSNQGPAAAGSRAWHLFVAGQLLTVPEADLRPYEPKDPLSRMAGQRPGSPRQFVMTVAARARLADHQQRELMSVSESRIDPKPHQVSVVHRVISEYPHRFLLCDEVGLGKTIEAGMVLKELRARSAAKRCIVIAPPNLVRQWQFELKTKFNESFSVLNADTVKYLKRIQRIEGNPFEHFDSVIVSSSWVSEPSRAALAAEVDWDMVVVDEAHHARVRVTGNRRTETRLYKTVRQLVAPHALSQRAALLLTATPMQLHSNELYSLVELLDPALFPSEEHFRDHRDELPGLNRLVQQLQIHGFPIPDRPEGDTVRQIAHWLQIDPDEAQRRLTSGVDSVHELCHELAGRHLLSEVLIRNRKSVVGGFMPRNAARWKVKLTAEERAVLDAVQQYVRHGFALAEANSDQAYGFLMTTFQKLMASSNRALRTSLERRRQRLVDLAANPKLTRAAKAMIDAVETSLDDDGFVSEVLAEIAAAHDREADILGELVALLDSLEVDSKADKFVKRMTKLKAKEPDVKVLIFTEFRETQSYVAERLAAAGWHVELFHGQLKPEEKDASVERFRDSSEATVLVSTEAGGEGRNFQFCHFLVNYDLPWNPMRVEQRIGRIDRIGQEHVVNIFNLTTKGTVEERVLDVLERRIRLFEDTVGGLDPILGEAEKNLSKILKLADEKREAALVRFEEHLEQEVTAARDAEEKLADLIMEVRSFDPEQSALLIGQPAETDPDTHRRLMIRVLAEERTHLEENDDGTFVLTFNNEFRAAFPEIADGPMRRRVVSFRPDLHADSEHVEYFSLGHPVCDVMLDRVTHGEYEGSAGALSIVSTDTIAPGAGWFIVHLVSVSGTKETNRLVGTWVDEHGADVARGSALLHHLSGLPSARPVDAAAIPLQQLSEAVERAELLALAIKNELEESLGRSTAARTDKSLRKLAEYFDVRHAAAEERLQHAEQIVAELRLSPDEERRKIIPVWEANARRAAELVAELCAERERRLDELDRQAHATGTVTLAAVGWIDVVQIEQGDAQGATLAPTGGGPNGR